MGPGRGRPRGRGTRCERAAAPRRPLALLLGVLVLGACSGDVGSEAAILDSRERIHGSTLFVDLICEVAPTEEQFVAHVAERFERDGHDYPEFTEYRFRLRLIPEGDEESIAVLFSYMFFDLDANRTSDVEAFDFLIPRGRAGALAEAGTRDARQRLYETLREEQPSLNPDFARRLPPPEGEVGI